MKKIDYISGSEDMLRNVDVGYVLHLLGRLSEAESNLRTLREAVENLKKTSGRHNTEKAYEKLIQLL